VKTSAGSEFAQHASEEPACRSDIAAARDERVDHLAVLVDRPVDVPPNAADLQVGLVHEPPLANGMAAGPGGIDHERRKVLHSPVQAHVVNLDPVRAEKLLEVPVGQAERKCQRSANRITSGGNG